MVALKGPCGVCVPVQREWSDYIYTKGCMVALEDWLPGNLYTVAVVFIVISLLQVQPSVRRQPSSDVVFWS